MIAFFLLISIALCGNQELDNRVAWEIDHIGYPDNWVKDDKKSLQVAIIGSGMAGIAAGYGLFRVGIHNITLFDECEAGLEGPWLTYGQMKILRTPKEAVGPSLFTPSLTFQAWYESTHGQEAWDQLIKASPLEFGQYLNWLKTILKLPVINQCKLKEIIPLASGLLQLNFERNGLPYSITTKKVILATGRKGFGGFEIPSYAKNCSHASEIKDYKLCKGKKIAILGCGTSAYDAAGAALEAGAISVDLIYRRLDLPTVNKWDALGHVGMEHGFYKLPDEWKFKIVAYVHSQGTPAPDEALARVKPFLNFRLNPDQNILKIDKLNIVTDKCTFAVDHFILATGYKISAHDVPELKTFASSIKLWKDQGFSGKTATFPYLGPHFQFLEKIENSASFLKHIYCFNYGALASHGLTSSAIDPLSVGAELLSKGIAADFFVEEIDDFFNDLEDY